MLALLCFVASLTLSGAAATAWLGSIATGTSREGAATDATGPVEAIASSVFVATSLGVAFDWLLSPLRAIRPAWLLVVSGLAAVASLAFARGQMRTDGLVLASVRSLGLAVRRIRPLDALLIGAPILAWLVFITWRGSVTLALSHDALSYHLPRAVDVVRHGGWRYLPVEDFRLAWFPSNYELMLADVIALTGSDRATPLVAIGNYASAVLLFAAWGERHWGGGARGWLGALLWAGTPLALLHSGGHKNDLLMMECILATALWGARWVVEGSLSALVLTGVACGMSLGTKATGAFAAFALLFVFAPFGLVKRLRETLSSPARLVTFLAAGGAIALLTGVAPIVAHAIHPRMPTDLGMSADEMARVNITPTYGEWSNLWRFPALLWLRAFSNDPMTVFVPWRDARWFWPKDELYFSDFGVVVSSLALLVPIGIAARRRPTVDPCHRREHAAASLYLLAMTALVLPIRYRIDGAFDSYPRYVLFLPLLIADWGAVALLERYRSERAAATATRLTLFGAAVALLGEGFVVARDDHFAPLDYLQFLLRNPGDRSLAIEGEHAAQRLDAVAGPYDRVAVGGGFGAWIYPAYGAGLTRDVTVLPVVPSERSRVLGEVDWVVIDRAWPIAWGAPDLTDMGRVHELMFHGALSAEDLAFFSAMAHDSRFTAAFVDLARGQAIFRRKEPRAP